MASSSTMLLRSSRASAFRAASRRPTMTVVAAARPKTAASATQVPAIPLPLPLPSSFTAQPNPTGHVNDAVWLEEKLNTCLGGLETATRRAKVRALRVLHVTGARMSYSPNTQRPRCTALDLDIAWEAEPLGAAKEAALAAGTGNLRGLARVKLSTKGCDRVQISDVQVLDDSDTADGAPSMPSTKEAPKDVLLAVQSLDGVIMEQLNGFMWELEQSHAGSFPLNSFELDEDDHDDQEGSPPDYDPATYTTTSNPAWAPVSGAPVSGAWAPVSGAPSPA